MTRDEIEPLCDLIRDLFGRVFSAARAFMFFKLSAFVVGVGAIGFGLIAQVGSESDEIFGGIKISEPGLAQILVIAFMFIFAIGANVYVMTKSREHELRLEELQSRAPAPLKRRLGRRRP